MGLIAAVSFATQSLLSDDSAHMWLISRLWQFMCGFFTYHLHESGILAIESLFGAENESKEGKKDNIKQIQPVISESLKLAMLVLLFVGLCMESIYDFRSQLHRLGVVLITMLIMAQKIPSYLLELKPMIALGDCSYSVYLVHWPLFSFHRYWYPEHYDRDHDYPNFIGNIRYTY
jgi:peptidoglycan/LPS O-acetylase OafA/YrhL